MRRRPQPLPDPVEDDVPDFDARCDCGHREAEHSMFGPCHGCDGCAPDDDPNAEHTHPYDRCSCTDFRLAVDVEASTDFALTG